MNTSNRKTEDVFNDTGFGFPVRLRNAPMILALDEWMLDVNQNSFCSAVLVALAHSPIRLSGRQIRFIRQAWSMTLQAFAERFAVSHPAVLKWEKCESDSTSMNWSTEKDLRLEILRRGGTTSDDFLRAFERFSVEFPIGTHTPIEIDASKLQDCESPRCDGARTLETGLISSAEPALNSAQEHTPVVERVVPQQSDALQRLVEAVTSLDSRVAQLSSKLDQSDATSRDKGSRERVLVESLDRRLARKTIVSIEDAETDDERNRVNQWQSYGSN